jgi:hypothetical protein
MKLTHRALAAILICLLLVFAIPASAQTGNLTTTYSCVLTYNGGFPGYTCYQVMNDGDGLIFLPYNAVEPLTIDNIAPMHGSAYIRLMRLTNVENYKGFTIERNECGFFNIPTINCFSSPSVESARRAIEAYEARKAEKKSAREFAKAFTPNRHGEYA